MRRTARSRAARSLVTRATPPRSVARTRVGTAAPWCSVEAHTLPRGRLLDPLQGDTEHVGDLGAGVGAPQVGVGLLAQQVHRVPERLGAPRLGGHVGQAEMAAQQERDDRGGLLDAFAQRVDAVVLDVLGRVGVVGQHEHPHPEGGAGAVGTGLAVDLRAWAHAFSAAFTPAASESKASTTG